ncbi:hypothetical protein GCM10009828_018100 [Actinoplanes couchii]|uniref:Uncharacterized protein n=1 Tax=Actinoplanes couchii TaxID=403638 RepID=A0ABQ3XE23_9ACTN|nr:hypothetical protein Aco03nite_051580 [Actinoplanes couchii]
MDHRIDIGQRRGDRGPVGEVGPPHRNPGHLTGRWDTVGAGMAGIQDCHVMAGVEQGRHDMGSDEAGAAGH